MVRDFLVVAYKLHTLYNKYAVGKQTNKILMEK